MEPRVTRILLVDEEAAHFSALEAMLEPLGQCLIRAGSGQQALRLALDEDFAVILLGPSLGLPRSLEVMDRLRESGRRTPILLLTAADIAEREVLEAYAHGAADHLREPVLPPVLRARVGTFVELQLARARLRWHEAEVSAGSLRQGEQQLRLLANSMSQLAWISDAEGRVGWYNERWYEYTGSRFEQMRDLGWQAVHVQEDVGRVMATWRQALAEGRLWEDQFRLRGADGVFRWFLTRAVPVRDAAGHIVQWFGTNTDIDEARRAHEELRRAETEIRRLNIGLEDRVRERTSELQLAIHELESFSYSVSHDLRAPLRHVLGYAQMLERRAGASLDDVARGHLKTIATAARDGGVLVDDLLEFSRLGRTELRRSRVDLTRLVGEVRLELELETKDRELEWRVGPLPTVSADLSLLRQVLRNLLANAVKYTRPRAQVLIELGARRTRDGVEVWVRDNGVGFDMRYADKLFGVFQRLHTAEQFEGTGIGLANVRRIISRHGGRTWAEGEVERGATFHFTLPEPPSVSAP